MTDDQTKLGRKHNQMFVCTNYLDDDANIKLCHAAHICQQFDMEENDLVTVIDIKLWFQYNTVSIE